jgi:hypothetical protein
VIWGTANADKPSSSLLKNIARSVVNGRRSESEPAKKLISDGSVHTVNKNFGATKTEALFINTALSSVLEKLDGFRNPPPKKLFEHVPVALKTSSPTTEIRSIALILRPFKKYAFGARRYFAFHVKPEPESFAPSNAQSWVGNGHTLSWVLKPTG